MNLRKLILWLAIISSLFSTNSFGQQLHKLKTYELVNRQFIQRKHSENFEQIQVQDFQGRIQPIHTLALSLLRKIHGKNTFQYENKKGELKKLNATQVFIGMQFKPDSWQLLPIIKVENTTRDTIQKLLTVEKSGFAKPAQFFDFSGNYKLKKLVADAFAKAEGKRNTLDKNIIKLDERLNIVWAIFNGQFLRVFPNSLDANQKWFSPKEETSFPNKEDQVFFDRIIPTYFTQLQKGIDMNQWEDANTTIDLLKSFQTKNAYTLLIPKEKLKWEIFYNKKMIFFVCMILYTTLGFPLLILGFINLFFEKKWITMTSKIILALTFITFLYHGFGIGLRWYISGHAPWSNGYEATIFISWVGLLSGILFSKKTKLPTAATALIAVCLMGIAHGNLMNPEITNLVPVLKSYWLMIHVAIITGSYGFLV